MDSLHKFSARQMKLPESRQLTVKNCNPLYRRDINTRCGEETVSSLPLSLPDYKRGNNTQLRCREAMHCYLRRFLISR